MTEPKKPKVVLFEWAAMMLCIGTAVAVVAANLPFENRTFLLSFGHIIAAIAAVLASVRLFILSWSLVCQGHQEAAQMSFWFAWVLTYVGCIAGWWAYIEWIGNPILNAHWLNVSWVWGLALAVWQIVPIIRRTRGGN